MYLHASAVKRLRGTGWRQAVGRLQLGCGGDAGAGRCAAAAAAAAAAADARCRRSRRARAFLRPSLQVRRRRGGRRVRGLGLRQIRLQSILHTLQHKVAFLHTSGHVPATWMQWTTYAAVAARQREAQPQSTVGVHHNHQNSTVGLHQLCKSPTCIASTVHVDSDASQPRRQRSHNRPPPRAFSEVFADTAFSEGRVFAPARLNASYKL